MASLQARHQRSCPLYPWTPFARATRQAGCTCTPLYHVVHRHDGKLIRDPVGHNRKEAERALDARRGDLARRQYRTVEDVSFDAWAEQWLAGFTGKENSRRVYAGTLAFAREAFGRRKVRDVSPSDVRRLLDLIRAEYERRQRPKKGQKPRPIADATLAKHLRQLGACLQAAVAEGYASENPVRALHKTARPRVAKSRPSYYTDAELRRLWPELAERPLMLALCQTAVLTGARLGELAALCWTDVDLLDRELRIGRTWTPGVGETSPKSGEVRTVDLTPQAVAVLERWFRESGGGDGLVFEREEGGHLDGNHITKQVLYPALERAGVSREGEHGRKRDFHSFRHTFARIALESGAEIVWVQRQLGHSSITLTVDTYGHWSRSAEKARAKKLAGKFPV